MQTVDLQDIQGKVRSGQFYCPSRYYNVKYVGFFLFYLISSPSTTCRLKCTHGTGEGVGSFQIENDFYLTVLITRSSNYKPVDLIILRTKQNQRKPGPTIAVVPTLHVIIVMI